MTSPNDEDDFNANRKISKRSATRDKVVGRESVDDTPNTVLVRNIISPCLQTETEEQGSFASMNK